MSSDERHKIAWEIMERRWQMLHSKRNWTTIANEVSITQKELREIRLSPEYEHIVWAEYERNSRFFNRHRTYEQCIAHIQRYYGIPRRLAVEVLGKDWKEPEVKATQLQIDF